MKSSIAYIDATNLYKGTKGLGKNLDYKKFRVWLSQKFNIDTAILFMGFIPHQQYLYTQLKKDGYKIIFKETVTQQGKIKGNADAEMVLQCTRDYFEQDIKDVIIISGDGDFSCLVDFCVEKNIFKTLLIPNKKYCSYLLRKKNISTRYIQELIHLFSKKTPG